MYYFSWLIRIVALVFIFESAGQASHDPNNNNDEPFRKALASFKEARSTHPRLKNLAADKPTCFISYAWGISEHTKIVYRLAKHLEEAGINILLDMKDNTVGTTILDFAQKVLETDYVILVGSQRLMEKVNGNEDSVVKAEVRMIGQRLPRDHPNILPIRLEDPHKDVFPSWLGGFVSESLQDPTYYPQVCFSLLKALYKLESKDITTITDTPDTWDLKTKLSHLEAKFDTLLDEVKLLRIENAKSQAQPSSNLILEALPSFKPRLEEKSNSQPFRHIVAIFGNTGYNSLAFYTDYSWKAITFNSFSLDDLHLFRPDLKNCNLPITISEIIVPEDGIYSLSARYHWVAGARSTGPYTGIAIDKPTNVNEYYLLHHLCPSYQAAGVLTRVNFLKAGQKSQVLPLEVGV